MHSEYSKVSDIYPTKIMLKLTDLSRFDNS